MWFFVFMLLPIFGLAYVGWHIWALVPLSGLFRSLLIGCLVASFGILILNMGRYIEQLPMWGARLCYDIGSTSIFLLLYLTIIFLVLDLGRLLRLVPARWLHQNVYVTMVITAGLFAVFLGGNIHYYNKKRVPLTLITDKPLERPLKFVMASDLHLGYHNPRKELARWVDMINGEQPDVVLIAGDIIDNSIRPLEEERMAEEFHRLKAPVYACLGNHEYFSSRPAARRFYKEAGIRLLSDSVASVAGLTIIGRDDRTNQHRLPLAQIAAKADLSRYTIVIDHQPYRLEEAEGVGADFQFSGHTHYGQVWPISWITNAVYECAFGEYRRGNTRYYVSSGLGIWGGKYRIGTRSEYVVAELKNAE